MHTLTTVLVIALVIATTANTSLTIYRIRRRQRPTDPKPLEVLVTDTDGQWRLFRLGPGDAIGFAGIRIDATARNRIELTHYTDPDA